MNTLYPGLSAYKGLTKGWFTCIHHEGKIIEWSDNVMERVEFILKEKADHEVETRLHHIVYVPEKEFPYKEINDAFIKKNIHQLTDYLYSKVPNCKWDGRGLMFPRESEWKKSHGYGTGNGDGNG